MFTILSLMVLKEKANQDNKYSLERLQKEPASVFTDLYREFRSDFLTWGQKSFGAHTEELIDIFQDSVVVLYNNLKQEKLKKLDSSLKTYLFAIGKNILLKRLNNQKVEIPIIEEVLPEIETDDPESLYTGDEIERKVAELVREMKEPCKSIIRFYYYDNFSMDEIATKLGYKNSDTAKSQKLRCIKYLKNAITID